MFSILNFINYLKNKNHQDINIVTGNINIDLLKDNDYTEKYKHVPSCYMYGYQFYLLIEYTSHTCLDHHFLLVKLNSMKRNICIYTYY